MPWNCRLKMSRCRGSVSRRGAPSDSSTVAMLAFLKQQAGRPGANLHAACGVGSQAVATVDRGADFGGGISHASFFPRWTMVPSELAVFGPAHAGATVSPIVIKVAN